MLLVLLQVTRASQGPAVAFVLSGACSDHAFPRKARQARTRLSRKEPFSTNLCPTHPAVRAMAGSFWKSLNYNGMGTDGTGMRACIRHPAALSEIADDTGVGLWTVRPRWYNGTATCVPKTMVTRWSQNL